MRLLIDANLSWRLVKLIKNDFPDVIHLVNTQLKEAASDTEIWNFASENDYTIVTNDDDFYLLTVSKGFPPKIILLKTGNQSTKYVAELLIKHKSDIENFTLSIDYGVLEIF